jgi:Matrixin/Abnormal spindle-like microcephaly-assoc'd, ASPM-SPD-2-Hydin/Repeat of unknown function (DUF5648)
MSTKWNETRAMRAGAVVAGVMLASFGLTCTASAASGTSDYSMSQVGAATRADAKYVPMFDPTARWPATFQWKYNAANAPAQLDKASVVATLQAAFDKWSSQCNVKAQYAGETSTPPHATDNVAAPDYENVIGWGSLSANSAWTYDWWQSNATGGRDLVDADMLLSVQDVTYLAELDRVATHEFGHAIGLNHSNLESAIMAGPPLTQYNMLVTPQADDVRGCRCLYGLPAGASAPYVCQLPASVDFGTVPLQASSAPKSVAFHNSGNAPLSIDNVSIGDATFRRAAGCAAGTIVPPGGTCTLQIAATPTRAGPVASTIQLFTNDGMYELPLTATGDDSAALPPPQASVQTVNVVEFYNATLDHYFITWIDAEIANLDAGLTPSRWTRTGYSFKAYATTQPGTSNICRFYIPPADGNSHFFGRSPAECSAAQQEHPEFVLEDANYMQLYVPTAGACPSGSTPIYRLFDNRADVNHRYTTDRGVRDAMVAKGWIAEGDGPDRVVMCAPQ